MLLCDFDRMLTLLRTMIFFMLMMRGRRLGALDVSKPDHAAAFVGEFDADPTCLDF